MWSSEKSNISIPVSYGSLSISLLEIETKIVINNVYVIMYLLESDKKLCIYI